jgi:UDP-3-O-[3-hydroxymyristoyl] glucosamine N-acyltransferase
VQVDDFAVIAGVVGIANKVRVGKGSQISAFSAVQSHIPAGEVWGGVPAMPHRQWLKAQVFIRKLPELLGRSSKKWKENE